ncbi:MAG: hypothetical protein WC558_03990 [Patulibacter sp.]
MLSQTRFTGILAPVADAILAADAVAVAEVLRRREYFAAMDRQPGSAAMAMERRGSVVTAVRGLCAGQSDWKLRRTHLSSGAYEWEVGDDGLVRLSKTTKESRQEQVLSQPVADTTLFGEDEVVREDRDVILIRLDGNPLSGVSVSAALLKPSGKVHFSVPLQAIAKSTADDLVQDRTAPKTDIRLPQVERRRASGDS